MTQQARVELTFSSCTAEHIVPDHPPPCCLVETAPGAAFLRPTLGSFRGETLCLW